MNQSPKIPSKAEAEKLARDICVEGGFHATESGVAEALKKLIERLGLK